ncbi:MAG: (2Fe-2S)-binding protein [Chloroflexi bacterium]|nr:(2Fe-2S)-binding protein [Chloroflexota bacterium]
MSKAMDVTVTVNGEVFQKTIEPRLLLSDFIRHELNLSGTHVGCEHGVCGACTILFDGMPVRSCLMFAVQADGHEIRTVEDLGTMEDLHPLQEAFQETHALQCGFCTSGFLMSILPVLEETKDLSEEDLKRAMEGILCRCTGYQHIRDAVRLAAEKMSAGGES